MSFRRVLDPERLHALIDAIMLIESDLDISVLLTSIVAGATELVGARYGALGISSADGRGLTNFITVGLTEEQRRRIGDLPQGHGVLGQTLRDAAVRHSSNLTLDPAFAGFPANHPIMTTFLGVPVLRGDGHIFGTLYLCDRCDGADFTDEDQAIVEAFGRAAGLVVDEAQLRAKVRDLTLSEERERLARDLHDTVIQRLFAVGLSLQSLLMTAESDDVRDRLNSAVDNLDGTIREIRTTIFEMSRDRSNIQGLRARILAITDEVSSRLNMPVDITFDGPLDTLVGPVAADYCTQVLRELLTNVVRHAAATKALVAINVRSGVLSVEVTDNGRGLTEGSGGGHGLINLEERARELAGTFALTGAPGGGTCARWTATRLDNA